MRINVCSLRNFSPFIRYSATMLLHWLDCDNVEEGTSVAELFGDFSREPTEIPEIISSALNLSVLFKGIPSCKLQCLAEKMHRSVVLFSLIDLRSSYADRDKHILYPVWFSQSTTLKMKQRPSQNSFSF